MFTVYAKLVITMALWGGTFVSGRLLAQGMGPLTGAFLRFVLGSIFLLLVCMRVQGGLPKLRKDQILPVLFLALTGVFLYNLFFLSGLKLVEAGRSALIIATAPSMIAVASALIFREPLGWIKMFGVVLSLCGAATVISRGDISGIFTQAGWGELYILGCVVSWVGYTLGGKKVMVDMSPLNAVTWSSILGAGLLLPAALADGMVADISSSGIMEWGNAAYLGVFGTGFGFTWFYQGIKALGASRAGIFINLVPVFGVTLGFLILGEPVNISLVAGAALIITGVWLVNRPVKVRQEAENEPPSQVAGQVVAQERPGN